jgi:hypothetical protein
MTASWLQPHVQWLATVVSWVEPLLIWWIPIYLLIMQKRVYRQGWPMTVLKWWFIGWFYLWLLMIALVIAAALGMGN